MSYDLALTRVLLSRDYGDGGFAEALSAIPTADFSKPERKWVKEISGTGTADVEIYSPLLGDGVRAGIEATVPPSGQYRATISRLVSPLPPGAVVRGRGMFTSDSNTGGTRERKFRLHEKYAGLTLASVDIPDAVTDSVQTFGPTTLAAGGAQCHVEITVMAGNLPPSFPVNLKAKDLLVEESLDLSLYVRGDLSDSLRVAAETFLLHRAGVAARFQGLAARTFSLALVFGKPDVAVRNRLLQLWGKPDNDPLRMYVASDDRYLPIEPLNADIEQIGGGAETVTLNFALASGYGTTSRARQGVSANWNPATNLRLQVSSVAVRNNSPCDIALYWSSGAVNSTNIRIRRVGGQWIEYTATAALANGSLLIFEGSTGKLWERTLTTRVDRTTWLKNTSQFPRLAPGVNDFVLETLAGSIPTSASIGYYEVSGEPDYL